MKSKQIYRIAKGIWVPILRPMGFAVRNGRYLRIHDSGVVQLIGIGMDPHGAGTFRVMCGVDSVQIREALGLDFAFLKADGLYHLTPSGWDYNSGRWPCETEEEALASLTMLRSLILELAIPYFDPITTLSHVGDEINETRMPHLGWMKAKLYLLDGDIPRARETIARYAAWAARPRNWGTQAHQQEDMERAERLRLEIEAAAGGRAD